MPNCDQLCPWRPGVDQGITKEGNWQATLWNTELIKASESKEWFEEIRYECAKYLHLMLMLAMMVCKHISHIYNLQMCRYVLAVAATCGLCFLTVVRGTLHFMWEHGILTTRHTHCDACTIQVHAWMQDMFEHKICTFLHLCVHSTVSCHELQLNLACLVHNCI